MKFWKALLGQKSKGLEMMEIDKQAKIILLGGEALTLEIEAAILDIVINNAPGIESFHERREELTQIDYEYLYFYAVSLVLFLTSDLKNWTEGNINSIIDKAAEEIVRVMSFRFRSPDQGDPKCEKSAVATQLRGMFENVRSNFHHLGEIGEEKESNEANFTITLAYFRRIHPPSKTLILERNTALLDALLRSFGLISISAHRYVSD